MSLMPYIVAISRILSWSPWHFKRFKNLTSAWRPKWAERLSYRSRNTPIQCRTFVVFLLAYCRASSPSQNSCRVIAGSLRVTYNLLRYDTIIMQRYDGFIMTSLRVFSTTVRQCASICELFSSFLWVRTKSHKTPINGSLDLNPNVKRKKIVGYYYKRGF